MQALVSGALLLTLLGLAAHATPSNRKIAADAADFHRFRIALLAKATEIGRHSSDENAAGRYMGAACAQLAHRTSPDYMYGVVADLMRDTSRTEDPYMVAVMVLDQYPPQAARNVVREIMANPKFFSCPDIQNWTWEIDEAEKARKNPKHAY